MYIAECVCLIYEQYNSIGCLHAIVSAYFRLGLSCWHVYVAVSC